jgi:ribonuclease HII
VARGAQPNALMEATWWAEGYKYVAGVDEAGRGALLGPLVAAAVVFPPGLPAEAVPGLRDSKLLSPPEREAVYSLICRRALAIGLGIVGSSTVDHLGIGQATCQAMRKAVQRLQCPVELVVIDGRGVFLPGFRTCACVDADAKVFTVAAASIVAKVTRDRLLDRLAARFPSYGLERNKGYGTDEHLAALAALGPTPLHRRTFAPLAQSWPGSTRPPH